MSKLKTFRRSWPYKYLISPVLTAMLTLGPTCFVAFSKNDASVHKFITDRTWLLIICYCWPVLSHIMIRTYKEYRKNKKNLNFKTLLKLCELIEDIVGEKSNRFAKAITSESISDPADIFNRITQPQKQINKIMESLSSFYELTKNENEDHFRIALAKMGDRHIEEFVYFSPNDKPPRGELKDYQKDTCGFTKARKKGSFLIVEDLAKHCRKADRNRFYAVVNGQTPAGSIMVYPVTHRGLKKVTHCISILCTTPNFFNKSNSDFHEGILNKFANRIELEHSLEILKEESK